MVDHYRIVDFRQSYKAYESTCFRTEGNFFFCFTAVKNYASNSAIPVNAVIADVIFIVFDIAVLAAWSWQIFKSIDTISCTGVVA